MKELSIGATAAWQIAVWEAAWLKHQHIEKEHLLCGVCSLEKVLDNERVGLDEQARTSLQAEQGRVLSVLREFEIDPVQLRRQVRAALGKGSFERTEKVIHRSEECKRLFAEAGGLAGPEGEINCLHLLDAIVKAPGVAISTALAGTGVKPEDLVKRVMAEIVEGEHGAGQQAGSETPYLDRYGRDLTRLAREGKLGPFIGRRKELLQVIQTLARKTKSNPVLVGEAGVGKTAIVEALAVRVAQGKNQLVRGHDPESKRFGSCPRERIVELSMGVLVAGTSYRGQFEERLTRLIGEARSHPEVIIFIDELHTLIGAGGVGGSLDAANILKPALANGELRCIGATTIAEFRRYVESDPALERRFEKVIVDEPSRDEALEILKGIRAKLEEHHHVRIADQALEAAVDLSLRFDTDHHLPDKAIDLVDKAAARTRVPLLSMMPGQDAADLEQRRSRCTPREVSGQAIAEVLSEKMGLPLEIVLGAGQGAKQSRLLALEAELKERIKGQDEAIGCICRRLMMAHAGIAQRRGPLAVFLFMGPTGVGKTETARTLAARLFGSESQMIRLDMSEYMEEHSTAKLIGSPPGYIGHDEEGQLTGKLRTRPYSVVLLDEIEKAHARVFDLFLQVFDDGRLTDSKGRTADARNAIFVMTSNIAVGHEARRPLGFGAKPEPEQPTDVRQELARRFRPEFINRIDEIVVFKPLGQDSARLILRGMLDDIVARLLKQHGVTLEISEEAEELLLRTGFSATFGARELRRTVERMLEMPLSQMVVRGRAADERRRTPIPEVQGKAAGRTWHVTVKGEGLSITAPRLNSGVRVGSGP